VRPPLHLPGRLQELKRRAGAVTCGGSESSCLARAKAGVLASDAFTLGSDEDQARRANRNGRPQTRAKASVAGVLLLARSGNATPGGGVSLAL
jgi:hypothetical protein